MLQKEQLFGKEVFLCGCLTLLKRKIILPFMKAIISLGIFALRMTGTSQRAQVLSNKERCHFTEDLFTY